MKNLYCKTHFSFIIALLLVSFISSCAKKATTTPNSTPDGDSGVINVPDPVIYGISPQSGLPNTVIKISGSSFNTTPGSTIVYLNDLQMPISSITSTQITVTVPATANSGQLVLRTGTAQLQSPVSFTVMYGTVDDFISIGGGNQLKHLALDRQENAFSDNGTSIYKILSDGRTQPITSSTGDFKAIADFTILAIGDMYVANAGNFNIVKITPDKTATVFAGNGTQGYADGTGTAAKFSAITGITHDVLGNLYVNDAHRVRKISTAGVVTTIAGNGTDGYANGKGADAQFGNLEGIAIDDEGTIYVTDREFRNIRRISADGVVTTLAGSGATGLVDGAGVAAQFTNPRQLAIDLAGNIWVTDENPSLPVYEVREINKLGLVTTFIKGTSNAGVLTGPAFSASVNSPLGMMFDPAGNLYIANTGARVISKVTFYAIK
ncbi:MAG: repeat containing protein [Mucilaginibacter sp.]|uniref:NHL domain-containing protein n=1 Tax=Mucilaginibacter sp. TaxID=1882438 RepID=UPI002611B929|nr:IPT/TIG domain-containing protein [Mucilaginibacter sp.]MDB5002634.1 repeat containing protein [Mucilaginibacter sp.]